MSIIGDTEDALLHRLKALLDGRVRGFETAPADWDADYVKRILPALPGVFVVFEGGAGTRDTACLINSRWTIVAVTAHAQSVKARARGDVLQIGCYDILEAIAPALHGQHVFRAGEKMPQSPIGTLLLESWDVEAPLKFENISLMSQSMTFTMKVELQATLVASALAPFKRFDGVYEFGAEPSEPKTSDTVMLPQ